MTPRAEIQPRAVRTTGLLRDWRHKARRHETSGRSKLAWVPLTHVVAQLPVIRGGLDALRFPVVSTISCFRAWCDFSIRARVRARADEQRSFSDAPCWFCGAFARRPLHRLHDHHARPARQALQPTLGDG